MIPYLPTVLEGRGNFFYDLFTYEGIHNNEATNKHHQQNDIAQRNPVLCCSVGRKLLGP